MKESKDSRMRILQKIQLFFKQKTYSGRMKLLNDKVRDKLKDKADFIQGRVEKKFYYNWINKMSHLIGLLFEKVNIPLFNPEHKWRIGFNSLIVIFNCFYLYVISLKISFSELDTSSWYPTLQHVAQVMWIADMLIQMNTAMYHDNQFTKDRRIIMKIFIKEYFFFEVLPIIFENLHSNQIQLVIIFHLPLLLKLKGIMIMLKNLEFYILQILEHHSIFLLSKLFLKMILFGHILACCRNIVVTYELFISHEVTIWSQNYTYYTIDNQVTNYFHSMYWAISLMLNVTNPIPTTQLELIFTSCCMLISCIAFGYLLTAIGSILSQLNKRSEDYKQDLSILNNYMKRKKIEIGLKRRANISLKKFYVQQQRTKIAEERATLQKVDNKMLRELLISSNQRAIKFCPILTRLFSQSTIEQICVNCEEVFYAPNEVIIDNDSKHLLKERVMNLYRKIFHCFNNVVKNKIVKVCENYDRVQSGTSCEVLNQLNIQQRVATRLTNLTLLANLNQNSPYNEIIVQHGEYFGLVGFILGKQLISKAFSLDYSTVLRISISQVERIIENNSKDKETFMEMRDRLLYNNDITQLNMKCEFCQSKIHFSQDCFLLHFDKSNPFIHAKYNYYPKQMRSPFPNRNKQKYFNALKSRNYISENIEELKSNYGLKSSNNLGESYQKILEETYISKELQNTEIQTNNTVGDSQRIKSQNDKKNHQISIVLDDNGSQILESENNYQHNYKLSKNMIKSERPDKINKHKSQIYRHKEEENHQQKQNIYSYYEPKFQDQNQLSHSQMGGGRDEILKYNKKQQQRLNSMPKTQNQYQQKQNQLGNKTKSLNQEIAKTLDSDKIDELLINDPIEEEISMKFIQRMPSKILQKVNRSYFQNDFTEKQLSSSLNSQYNVINTNPENIIVKQLSSHLPNHKQHLVKQKSQLQNNSQYSDKQNPLTNSSQRQKTTISQMTQCSQSINLSSSLSLTQNMKESTSHNQARKEFKHAFSRLRSKLTSQNSGKDYENDLANQMASVFEEYDELICEDISQKQDNQEVQNHRNEEVEFYWEFVRVQNYQYYFLTCNSENQIKQYNKFISLKKLSLQKSKNSSKRQKNPIPI